jgi:hypothetical protein
MKLTILGYYEKAGLHHGADAWLRHHIEISLFDTAVRRS